MHEVCSNTIWSLTGIAMWIIGFSCVDAHACVRLRRWYPPSIGEEEMTPEEIKNLEHIRNRMIEAIELALAQGLEIVCGSYGSYNGLKLDGCCPLAACSYAAQGQYNFWTDQSIRDWLKVPFSYVNQEAFYKGFDDRPINPTYDEFSRAVYKLGKELRAAYPPTIDLRSPN